MTGTGIGAELKAARERLGLSAADLAAEIKANLHVVEDLDADKFSRLPAPIYVRGFIKLYAERVGLDPKPLIALYNETCRGREPATAGRIAQIPARSSRAAAPDQARPAKSGPGLSLKSRLARMPKFDARAFRIPRPRLTKLSLPRIRLPAVRIPRPSPRFMAIAGFAAAAIALCYMLAAAGLRIAHGRAMEAARAHRFIAEPPVFYIEPVPKPQQPALAPVPAKNDQRKSDPQPAPKRGKPSSR